MKSKILTVLAATIAMTGCGGGGGGNIQEDNAFTTSAPRIEIRPQNPQLPANTIQFPPETNSPYSTPTTVRVLRNDGTAIPDGVLVFLRSQDVRTLALTPQTSTSLLALADVTCAQTFGGMASFILHSGPQTGTVQLTASVTFPPVPGTISDSEQGRICTQTLQSPGSQTYFANRNFQVVSGPAPFERIEAIVQRATIPANTNNVAVSATSPFVSEVVINVRNINGQLVQAGTLNVAINPAIARFSTALDDPATVDVNENVLRTQGTVNVVAGRAVIYVQSTGVPGNFTLTISGTDAITSAPIRREINFTTAGVAGGLPSQIRISSDISAAGRVIYTQGTNGNNNLALTVTVTDASGQPINEPGVANLLLEILPVANGSGEVLAASGVADATSVRLRTIAGIGLATFRAGTRQGVVTVRATADRADNNIENGIQNAVFSQTSFIVSDGKLFDLKIVTPTISAIIINGIDPEGEAVEVDIDGQSITLPPDPDGTYSLTVSVVATDRQGNPVLPNSPIEFGMIDSPTVGFPLQGAGVFAISGNDGDPQELGSIFTAPTGQFTTAGGGAGPGDTLLVFAEESNGNRDLESSRIVARVNSSTSLNIQNRFNRNDDTGFIVNSGPVLPYVIGRNTTGNIASNVLTRARDGVATTRMTYPISAVGRLVAIWARGSGDVVDGSAELVSEAEILRFPGVANAVLTVSPSTIPANRTSQVQICYRDALRVPLPGVFVNFIVLGAGQTAVDGVAGNGRVATPTGLNGCTTASVNTAGVVGAGTTIRFSVGGAVGVVTVAAANSPVLQAIPSSLGGDGGSVLLRLLDGNGNPITGVQITGVCTGGGAGLGIGIGTPPGVTNAQGETTSVINASLNGIGSAGSGSCVFTAANGPSVTVTLQGVDQCLFLASPACPDATPEPAGRVFGIQLIPSDGSLGQVIGGGIVCTGGTSVCSVEGSVGTVISVTAFPRPGAFFCGYSGGERCKATPGNANVLSVLIGSSSNCVARFSAAPCAGL